MLRADAKVLEDRGHVQRVGFDEVKNGLPVIFCNIFGLNRGTVGAVVNLGLRLVRFFIAGHYFSCAATAFLGFQVIGLHGFGG